MKTARWAPGPLSLSVFLMTGCTTVPISDNILFAIPPLGDIISEQVADLTTTANTTSAATTADDVEFETNASNEELAELVEFFGRNQKHEGDINLLMGVALKVPDDYKFDLSFGKDTRAWKFTKDDFIPTHRNRLSIEAGYGPVDTLYVEATDIDEPRTARPLIVHCYGNGASLYNNATFTTLDLLPYGDVVQFEYPGFGGGTAEERTALRKVANFDLMTDALAADLNAQEIERPLIFWGHSLGGIVCANIASKVPQTDAVILEATGNDILDIAHAQIPIYAKPFIRLDIDEQLTDYRITDMLADFSAPILVLGAKKDKTLKVTLSRRIHKALIKIGRDSQYVELPGANHISIKSDPSLPDTINSFLQRITDSKTPTKTAQ